jgi:hypothetical protein
LFVVIGCGGSGGATGSAAAQTPAATASAEPASAGAATPEPPSGGEAASDVCGLVTPEELAKVFDVPSVTTTVFKGPPDTCSVDGEDGTPLAAWVLSQFQSGSVEAGAWEAMMSDPSAIEVSGIGDQAAHVPNTGFIVLRGDRLLSIGVMTGVGDASEEERRQLAEELGAIAAGRM